MTLILTSCAKEPSVTEINTNIETNNIIIPHGFDGNFPEGFTPDRGNGNRGNEGNA